MSKDEFDFDFDFEKEFGLDPSAFDGSDDAMSFTDEELGLSEPLTAGEDFDVSDLADLPIEDENAFSEDFDFDIPEDDSFGDMELEGFGDFTEEEDDAAAMVSRRNQARSAEPEPPVEEEPEVPVPVAEEEPKPRKERKVKEYKVPKESLFTRFVDLYFTPVFHREVLEEPQADPANPRRRRRKSKMQIFKEAYLPAIVVCVCMILVMSFLVGAISNFIVQRRTEQLRDDVQQQESISAEQQVQMTMQAALSEAAAYAACYSYDEAIAVLDGFLATVDDQTAYTQVTTQRSAYATAKNSLVSYLDPSTIPNLSFHMLMVDPSRAFRNAKLGSLYNRNYISIGEFQSILNELYNNGYVLVDFDSFTTVNGDRIFYDKTIMLPAGKKPIMITATAVNYYAYMINGQDTNEASLLQYQNCMPDAGGDGFANKLVLDANGDIKASYTDSNGETTIGDYDVIPILETFIKEHPDFSYQGARATVAISGCEGIFGYRITSDYISKQSMDFVNSERVGAKAIADALRAKGYDLACYTYGDIYGDIDYATKTITQISDDLNKWTTEIVSVIGEVDKFVFAKFSDLTNADYSQNSAKFKLMQEKGFKFFIGLTGDGEKPWADYKSSAYARQKRMCVTGNALYWRKKEYTGIFNCDTVIDLNTRVSVPN